MPSKDFAGVRIERSQLTADAKLRVAVADEDDVLDDDGCHGDGFAVMDITYLRLPCELTGVCVDGDGMRIERVVDDFFVAVTCAAIHDVAAGNANGSDIRMRLEDPLLREPGLGEIESDEIVWKRRHHV